MCVQYLRSSLLRASQERGSRETGTGGARENERKRVFKEERAKVCLSRWTEIAHFRQFAVSCQQGREKGKIVRLNSLACLCVVREGEKGGFTQP